MASTTGARQQRTSSPQSDWERKGKRPCFDWRSFLCCCRFSSRKSWHTDKDGVLIEPSKGYPETQHGAAFQGGGKVIVKSQGINFNSTSSTSTSVAVDQIEASTKSGAPSAKVVEDLKKRRMARDKLYELLAIPGNNVCADCGDQSPKWASTNLGVFLCIRCAGVHRSLGAHVSKMLSITLDEWTEEQVATMTALGGNDAVNAVYEAKIPEGENKPTPDTDMGGRTNWIGRKYDRREFHADGPILQMPPVVEYERSDSAVGLVEFVGILKVRVISGKGLAVRDVTLSSDPYVVLSLGNQKVHTRVIQQNLNPLWNEVLMLSIPSMDMPLRLEVFDKDTLMKDDRMGEATISLAALANTSSELEVDKAPSEMWSLNRTTESVHVSALSGPMSSKGPDSSTLGSPKVPSSLPSFASARGPGSSSFASSAFASARAGDCFSFSSSKFSSFRNNSNPKHHMWVPLEKVEKGSIELELELLPLSQEG